MTGQSPLVVSRGGALAALLLMLVAGAGLAWLVMRTRAVPATPLSSTRTETAAAQTSPAARPTFDATLSAEPPADVIVPLSKDAIERAGIVVTQVSTKPIAADLQLPGIVEPNAYRRVSVTPLVGGRVVRVLVQLGDRVRHGQSLAQIYSPELADARTKYVAARAMLEAHDRELQRVEKLVTIGAASKQELERIHAEHAAQLAEVESARTRLQLLGAAPAESGASANSGAAATIDVPAPIDGIVTARMANAGLNVDPASELFTIVDLSNVWVIASAYEKDLHRIHVGARATVTAQAYPELSVEARVSYIDPQLNEETRSAKLRVEVANPRGDLRLGMFATVVIAAEGGAAVLTIPKSALQQVGSHQVVYLPAANEPTQFIERSVRAGRSAGDDVEVIAGLKAGDSVVSAGSFFVRAEAERLGLRPSPGPRAPNDRTTIGDARAQAVQTVRIVVSEKGYEPPKVSLRPGIPARLTFLRTTDKTCGTEVVFPSLNVKRPLPLNEPVEIDFTPAKPGEIAFACGMGMLHGSVVVQ